VLTGVYRQSHPARGESESLIGTRVRSLRGERCGDAGIYHISSERGVRCAVLRRKAPPPMFERLNQRTTARSAALLLTIDNRLDRILQGWLLIFGLLAAARIALTPHPAHGAVLATV